MSTSPTSASHAPGGPHASDGHDAPTGLVGRLGGMLLHPRRTLEGALAAPGHTGDLMTAVVLLAAMAARPEASTSALLLVPESLIGGLGSLVRSVLDTAVVPIVAVSLISWGLERAARRANGPAGDGVFAAAMLTLTPYVALLLLGALLVRLEGEGVLAVLAELLPPRSFGGFRTPGLPLLDVARFAIAFGPTLLLLGWLTRRLVRRRAS